MGDRGPPTIRVRALVADVLRDFPTCEPPEGYLRTIPQHCDHTSTACVEGCTGCSIEISNAASIVTPGSAQTLRSKRTPIELRSRIHIARSLASGVESVLVGLIIVNVFNGVHLTERANQGSARLEARL